MRILAIVSYNGTNYQGWAKQANKNTVQDTIEGVLSQYFNRPISIYAAGRTDAGVHAAGQRFHFDVDADNVDLSRMQYSINCMLPVDIKIKNFEKVNDEFHARFSAKEKNYKYSIMFTSKNVFFYPLMWLMPEKIDFDLLNEVLTYFQGTHDFRNFTSKEEDDQNFVRTIYEVRIKKIDKSTINIFFRGNGFMRYMIRYIVGVSIEVAKGKMSLDKVKELLDPKTNERHIVSAKAPANGLILVDVIY